MIDNVCIVAGASGELGSAVLNKIGKVNVTDLFLLSRKADVNQLNCISPEATCVNIDLTKEHFELPESSQYKNITFLFLVSATVNPIPFNFQVADEYTQHFNHSVVCMHNLIHKTLQRKKKFQSIRIINVSSAMVNEPEPLTIFLPYLIGKIGLSAYLDNLNKELKERKVEVVEIYADYFDSNLNRSWPEYLKTKMRNNAKSALNDTATLVINEMVKC